MKDDEGTFTADISWLLDHTGAIRRTLPAFANVSGGLTHKVHEDYDLFVKEHSTDRVHAPDGSLEQFAMPPAHVSRFRRMERALVDASCFTRLLPRMALVALVSVYDAYLARIVRRMLRARPEILNSSARQLTFQQLSKFSSLDEARDFIVEKEVEGLLRQSHTEQFLSLETTLGIPLRKDLPIWGAFIELTERRNLFVHLDGVVSTHYLQVCRDNGVAVAADTKPGDQLSVTPQYFRQACDAVTEIGVKLGQVIWRRLLPDELPTADTSLLGACYEALVLQEYHLAATLCEFGCRVLPRLSSAEIKLMLQVNLAIAHRGVGRKDDVVDLVRKTDWSATSDKFKLAAAVLLDDYNEAALIMRRVGRSGEPSKEAYRDWPLFREFRKTDVFRITFQEIFGEPFRIPTSAAALEPERAETEESGTVQGGHGTPIAH